MSRRQQAPAAIAKKEPTAAERARMEAANSVRGTLMAMKSQLEMALPQHVTADRLLRVVMTQIQTTPKLLECDRTSFLAAVMTCAQLGLEPDGVLGQAYLVPFYTQGALRCQAIVGYKGYIALARNSGQVESIQAHEVRENDLFEYEYGSEPKLRHIPVLKDRGEIVAFYAAAKFKGGGEHFEVMSLEEVEAVRNSSQGYQAHKAGKISSTPWADHFSEMGKKTVIRRLAKFLPLSVQRAAAMEDVFESRGLPSRLEDGTIIVDVPEEPAVEVAATTALDAFAGESQTTDPPAEEETAGSGEEQIEDAEEEDDGDDPPVAGASAAPLSSEALRRIEEAATAHGLAFPIGVENILGGPMRDYNASDETYILHEIRKAGKNRK